MEESGWIFMDKNGVNIKELSLEFLFLKKKSSTWINEWYFVVARWHSSRDIAIKIQKKDAVSSAAFLDEAQLLKQLQHPNIIKLLGVSSETTPIYLLLEYMVNGRLSNYLREGKGHELGLSQLLWIAAQVSVWWRERQTDRMNEWMNLHVTMNLLRG